MPHAALSQTSYGKSDIRLVQVSRRGERHELRDLTVHNSLSVQHTLHAMGRAVLDTVDAVAAISLVMPNRHHLPVDLSRLGLVNRNEIFVAVDEPFGPIGATLSR